MPIRNVKNKQNHTIKSDNSLIICVGNIICNYVQSLFLIVGLESVHNGRNNSAYACIENE